MSKKVGFPVMSSMITALLFVIGLLLATLNIFIAGYLGTSHIAYGLIYFVALFLIGWALFSYSMNPELEDYQKNVAFFFLVLLVAVLLGAGVLFDFTIA